VSAYAGTGGQQSPDRRQEKVKPAPTNDEPMSEWIEIPRCRVLEVTRDELRADFDCLDENGNECARGTLVYMIRRRRDNRVFKLARFQPLDGIHRNAFYLEEWS
jgi:hypothetical protein